jgi:succinoglycan biosynthesis protein ExoM
LLSPVPPLSPVLQSPTPPHIMLISVCIITYQRPEGIRRLLEGLNRLEFTQIESPEIEVVVIDNDVAGVTDELCDRIKSDFKWSLKSEIEPQRGISYARNHAIACVSPDAEFIATIDDDEVPEPQWLDRLLLVQQQYNADVVSGPVSPFFPDGDTPEWVKKGGFFDLPRYATGDQIHVAFTNNVLVRADILRKLAPPFDERFAFTGGEDSHLFMRIVQAGFKMVWANEAIVHEWIPKARTTKKYILQRAYRSWSTHSLVERELYPSFRIQAIRIAKGMALIAIGILLFIPSLFQGQHAVVKALRSICRGSGTMAGLLGIHYEEYR